MVAIYSLWEDYRKKINGGFTSKKNLAITLTLSVLESKKQFSSVEFYTNKYGEELVKKYKIPFDKVHVVLDQFDNKLDSDHWAYVKLYTYSIQQRPFIHIDNDVILWDKIPNDVKSADLFFQNKEHVETHRGYVSLLRFAKSFPKVNFDVLMSNPTFAYNCGVVGCNNLEIIQEWKEIVDEYLFHPKNQDNWKTIIDKHSHNHLFEQYFISALIKIKGMQSKVKTLLQDDFLTSCYRDFKMTHLWGESKRKESTMQRIQNRLFKNYPQVINNFNFKQTHYDIFDDIYKNELWGQGQGSGGGSTPKITFEYRAFLSKFLKEHNIKSVVDLGCGDWQFSKLIDWDGIKYLGIDCVSSIIQKNISEFEDNNIKFKFQDAHQDIEESADLLIVKDVLIHWTNQEIIDFFNQIKSKNFKYILITNQTGEEYLNEDIITGQFHNIDINREPFNFNAQEIFKWINDDKITYLITN